MDRRHFLAAGLLAAAALPDRSAGEPLKQAAAGPGDLLKPFLALPGTKAAQIDVDAPGRPWRLAHDPDAPLLCGSCFKTFVLATYLREVEAGHLSEDEQLPINNDVRSLSSVVFEALSGTAPARIVLEAMIAHSDNTATDAAMLRVGADKVREFIRAAGLSRARIPDSTRRFFSYLTGFPPGVDAGWSKVSEIARSNVAIPSRPAINDEQTMVCPPSEFVSYYKRALAGEFFKKQETLREFKRIQAMADAIALVVPSDTPAYLKGGSISWNRFYCMAVAGQMIVSKVPVTFCMTLNWTDQDGSEPSVTSAYKEAVAGTLSAIRDQVLKG